MREIVCVSRRLMVREDTQIFACTSTISAPFQTSRRNNSHDLHADACLGFIAFAVPYFLLEISQRALLLLSVKNTNTEWMLNATPSIIKLNDVKLHRTPLDTQVFCIFLFLSFSIVLNETTIID